MLLAGGLGACDGGLPDVPPRDLRLLYTYDAGMLPRGQRLEIRGRQARYRETRGRAKPIEFAFRLSEVQHMTLYRALRDNRVLEITSTDRGRVYDRGGVSIRISWGDGQYRVRNAGNQFVDRRWHKEFNTIRRAFTTLIAEAKAQHARPSR